MLIEVLMDGWFHVTNSSPYYLLCVVKFHLLSECFLSNAVEHAQMPKHSQPLLQSTL